jgi:chemotaxis protein MotB
MRYRDGEFFLPDSDELTDDGKYVLETVADGMRLITESIESVRVSGHTADSGGTSTSNEWRLSSGRAVSVVDFFILLDAAEPDKFAAMGYGKYRPIATNETEEGREENRRVEIVFIRADLDLNDAAVMQDLMNLMYGNDYLQESDEYGDVIVPPEPVVPEIDDNRSDPDRTYVDKAETVVLH